MKIVSFSQIDHINGVPQKLSSIGTLLRKYDLQLNQAKQIISQEQPQIIFVNPNNLLFKVDEHLLNNSNVKIVCTASTGTNHIDKEYCQRNGIAIISLTTEYSILEQISSTAEMAFGLMLSVVRRIPQSFNAVKEFQWDCMNFLGRQLKGMTAGIVGYGRLGSMMAKYCSAFDMNVLVNDPYKTSPFRNVSLNEMCLLSDVISLHVHVSPETKGLFGHNQINKCKQGLFLINTSRGEIVCEKDVLLGLEKGILAGYGTDVLTDELGNITNSQIIKKSNEYNIVITPHIGGATIEAQELAYNKACDLLLEFLQSGQKNFVPKI